MTTFNDISKHLRMIAGLKKAAGHNHWHYIAYYKAASMFSTMSGELPEDFDPTEYPGVGAGIGKEVDMYMKFGHKTPNMVKYHMDAGMTKKPYELIEESLNHFLENHRIKFSGRLDVAGSVRRKELFCGDVDLVTDTLAEDVWAILESIEEVEIDYGGNKKIRFNYRGIGYDVRIAPAESYNAFMLHCTGSASNNIAMRKVAKSLGLTLNEYGLFLEGTDTRVVEDTSEKAYFDYLELDYLEPENR